MKKVSIIVPIYNVEKYLDECLNSIEKQSIGLKNIEVILINDGSKDKSIDIIKKYKRLHKDWIVIDRENRGLSVSRNEGIEKSTTRYIMFLDSDDYLKESALEDMYKIAVDNDSDIVIGRLNAFDSKGEYGYYSDRYIKNIATFNFKENKSILKATSVCSKLYKRELVKNIKFIPNLKHEDNYFTLMAYCNAKKITTVPNYYYYRRYREGERDSIMQNLSINTFDDLIENYSLFFSEREKDNYIVKFSIKNFNNYIISKLSKTDKILAKSKVTNYLKKLYLQQRISGFYYQYCKLYNKLYYILGKVYYNVRSWFKK